MNDEVVWELKVRCAAGQTVLSAIGELDLDTAPGLVAEFARQLEGGAESLVLDLERLAFVDSSGLGTLVGCWRRAQRAGVTFMIVNPTPSVVLALEVTGLDQVLPLSPSRSAGSL